MCQISVNIFFYCFSFRATKSSIYLWWQQRLYTIMESLRLPITALHEGTALRPRLNEHNGESHSLPSIEVCDRGLEIARQFKLGLTSKSSWCCSFNFDSYLKGGGVFEMIISGHLDFVAFTVYIEPNCASLCCHFLRIIYCHKGDKSVWNLLWVCLNDT